MKPTIKAINQEDKRPAALKTEELRDVLAESLRRALMFKLSPRAILEAQKTAAILTQALATFNEYNLEFQTLEISAPEVWAFTGYSDKWEDLSRHNQNKITDLVRSVLKEQKAGANRTGVILKNHVDIIQKKDEEVTELLNELEDQTYAENPELAAFLMKNPEISEFKLAAELLEFTRKNAGIVEVAEFVKKNLLNLAFTIYKKSL